MKKIVIIISAILMVSCGGGLKKNDVLGTIPALYAEMIPLEAEYTQKREETMIRLEALEESGSEKDLEALAKRLHNEEQKYRKQAVKLLSAMKDEAEKVTGKDVPAAFTEAFAQLPCAVASSKFRVDTVTYYVYMDLSVVAKEDFFLRSMELHYRVVATDGSIISKGEADLLSFNTRAIVQGQTIGNKDVISIALPLHEKPESWIDFAKVEFITKDEYAQTRITWVDKSSSSGGRSRIGGSSTVSKVSGNIQATYQQLCVCFYVLPECHFTVPVSRGQFTVDLPKELNVEYLQDLSEFIDEDFLDDLQVSDRDAMFAKLYLYAINDNYQGNVYYGKYDPQALFTEKGDEIENVTDFVYFDRDVTITGIPEYGRAEYNLNLKKGWNVVVYQVNDRRAYVSTSSIPRGAKWGEPE